MVTRYVMIWFFGMLAGGCIFLFLYGHKLEEQMLINRNLYLLNERYVEEIHNLTQSEKIEKSKRNLVIEEIRVTVLDPKPNDFVVTEVMRHLEKDLAQMKGKKTEQIAEVHPVFHDLLRKKDYVVNGKIAEVRLKTLVISRVLHLFVVVSVKTEAIG